jgi:isopentenyl phosphate kinase
VAELVFLKLGGSLLTDKARPRALRREVLSRLAAEISAALAFRPGFRLLIGQGGGSFAHTVASRYGTRKGVATPEEWRGYAATARAAAELNRIVIQSLADAGIPILPVQPSASAICRDGELLLLDERPIRTALANDLVPLVYGDVALDEVRGGTIVSTEQIFRWLAPRLRPARVLLVGEVVGVLTADPMDRSAGQVERDLPPGSELIPEITPASFRSLGESLGGARGVDVTGGMFAKVSEMIALLAATPSLRKVQIISGLVPGLVHDVLVDPDLQAGTLIVRESGQGQEVLPED